MRDIEATILGIYREAAETYVRVAPAMGAYALGYEILYGPPTVKAPILFIGYQPGGDKLEPLPNISGVGGSYPWPDDCEYAVGSFPLAKSLQVAFELDFLQKCTGLNAIFLRSKNATTYKATVPPAVRAEFKSLGLRVVPEIVSLLQPQVIVFIGFMTMQLFTSDQNVVLWRDKKALLSSSTLNGIPVLGMWHPTANGPQPTNDDLKKIGGFIRSQLDG